jgi:N-methylhydantoinase B/oxoprolinase/acetone carboxylase alpha subunit
LNANDMTCAKPNFEKVEQLFWADETTHKARSGE